MHRHLANQLEGFSMGGAMTITLLCPAPGCLPRWSCPLCRGAGNAYHLPACPLLRLAWLSRGRRTNLHGRFLRQVEWVYSRDLAQGTHRWPCVYGIQGLLGGPSDPLVSV